LDYQVNLKAQYEVMQLHRKLDRLQAIVEDRGAKDEAEQSAYARRERDGF
jgi:uncharacterized membrane protein